jgi:hypothetical protein
LDLSAKDELDLYLERIAQKLPASFGRTLRWLRQPSSFFPRLVAGVLLVLGGIFSFLPILGIWMLPLGLILLAEDLPFLQAPLLRSFQWIEARWAKRKR